MLPRVVVCDTVSLDGMTTGLEPRPSKLVACERLERGLFWLRQKVTR